VEYYMLWAGRSSPMNIGLTIVGFIYQYALYSLIYNLTKLIYCPPYRRQDQNCTPYMAVFDKDALSVLQ
jgi:hypothetical protein